MLLLEITGLVFTNMNKQFEIWYSKYFDDAVENYGGVDCTNPKGIAENAWEAAIEFIEAEYAHKKEVNYLFNNDN